MALIGTLRNKMTKWVVGFVAVAIFSFILNDLFGDRATSIFGGRDNSVGEIAGDRINIDEFQNTVAELENNFLRSMGRQPSERDMIGLREQAWTLLIARHAIMPQYEKVGTSVTTEELADILWGKNMDEQLKMAYMDSTGAIDINRMKRDLQELAKQPEGTPGRAQWNQIRTQLMQARERVKYENLILKTNYVTKAEAERQYHIGNDVAEIKYLYVPYYAVKGDSIPVTDADIKKYYDDNKVKYKSDETRSISYVTFPLTASSKDTLDIRTESERFAKEFHTAEDDSTFAAVNTQGGNAYERYNINTLPSYINRESAMKGLVLGPFVDNGSFKVVKVSDLGTDTAYQMKASHILIRWTDNTPEAKKVAKDKAEKILADLKKGANFPAKVLEFSEDTGSKTTGGDVGWFGPGGQRMVPEFEAAVKNGPKTGLVTKVVETNYGYHIINVTGKDNRFYKIATIERIIEPSQETTDEAYRSADMFASDLSGVDGFKARAKEQNVNVYDQNDIASSERYVGNLGDAREAVTWLYRDGKVGKVSNVFTLDRDYVVAVMTGKSDGGYRQLDDKLKQEITVVVRKEKQGQEIIKKLSGDASLEDLAKAYSRDAVIGSSSDVKLSAAQIQNIGYDPVAIGRAFSVENGKRTKPFAGESGVTVIEVQNKTLAPGIDDYSLFKSQIEKAADARGGLEIAEAIKDKADIEDRRYKIY
ncbi:MAG TPA: peptidylprolyl isomerase [Cyclobacteriaceae bacterium]